MTTEAEIKSAGVVRGGEPSKIGGEVSGQPKGVKANASRPGARKSDPVIRLDDSDGETDRDRRPLESSFQWHSKHHRTMVKAVRTRDAATKSIPKKKIADYDGIPQVSSHRSAVYEEYAALGGESSPVKKGRGVTQTRGLSSHDHSQKYPKTEKATAQLQPTSQATWTSSRGSGIPVERVREREVLAKTRDSQHNEREAAWQLQRDRELAQDLQREEDEAVEEQWRTNQGVLPGISDLLENNSQEMLENNSQEIVQQGIDQFKYIPGFSQDHSRNTIETDREQERKRRRTQTNTGGSERPIVISGSPKQEQADNKRKRQQVITQDSLTPQKPKKMRPKPTTADAPIELDSSDDDEDKKGNSSQRSEEAASGSAVVALGSQDVTQGQLTMYCHLFSPRFEGNRKHAGKLIFMDNRISFITTAHPAKQVFKIDFGRIERMGVYAAQDHLYVYMLCEYKRILAEPALELIYMDRKSEDKWIPLLAQIHKCDAYSDFPAVEQNGVQIRQRIEKTKAVYTLLKGGSAHNAGHNEVEGSSRYHRLFEGKEEDIGVKMGEKVERAFESHCDELSDLYDRKKTRTQMKKKKKGSKMKDEEEEEPVLLEYDGVPIRQDDLDKLDDGEFLNDEVIDFGLRYFRNRLHKDEQRHFLVYSTFFFSKLRIVLQADKGCGDVRKWTKGIDDIFARDFLFVPINDSLHWTLAVVCWAGLVDKPHVLGDSEDSEESEDEGEGKEPCILVFDSLGGRTRNLNRLYDYLNAMKAREMKEDITKPIKRRFTQDSLPVIAAKVPEQENSYDCGCFVIEYAKRLMKNGGDKAAELVSKFRRKRSKKDWFDAKAANDLRAHLRNRIELMIKKERESRGNKS